jgi:hypothetical protein
VKRISDCAKKFRRLAKPNFGRIGRASEKDWIVSSDQLAKNITAPHPYLGREPAYRNEYRES